MKVKSKLFSQKEIKMLRMGKVHFFPSPKRKCTKCRFSAKIWAT